MVATDALGASAFSVWVRVPPSVQYGVVAQVEGVVLPMVEQVRETTVPRGSNPVYTTLREQRMRRITSWESIGRKGTH